MAVTSNAAPFPCSPRSFLRDERGHVVDYALITAVFALIMLFALRTVSHTAGGNLTNTSNHLTNMAVHS